MVFIGLALSVLARLGQGGLGDKILLASGDSLLLANGGFAHLEG